MTVNDMAFISPVVSLDLQDYPAKQLREEESFLSHLLQRPYSVLHVVLFYVVMCTFVYICIHER